MATRTTAKRKGRRRNGLFSYLGGESYALKGSKKLLIPTKAELQQAARQAGREYGKRDRESGRGIKYSNMLVAFKDWIASIPQLPRGVSERDLKVKFTGGYHTADILRNPFSIGETIAIGAGSAVGGAIGSAFVEPLIGKVKKVVNNPTSSYKKRELKKILRAFSDADRDDLTEGLTRYYDAIYYEAISRPESKELASEIAIRLAIKRGREMVKGMNKNPFQPKNRRGNPLDVDTSISISPKVLQMAESFHGREVETITDYEELDNYESELADLGELRELEIVAKGRKSVIALTFDKDCPRLATRADGKQLYFVGGDQELSEDVLEDLRRKGADELSVHGGTLEKGDKRILPIGTVHTIAYFADKHHLEGTKKQRKGVEYEHTFGEENGIKPVLAYDVMNMGMILLGGDYRVEDVGIVN